MRGFIYGNWQTCITSAFAELELAEILVDGTKNIGYLANKTGIEPAILFRFLRCCAQLKFIMIDAGTKDITLTDFGKYLLRNHPGSQRDAALLNGAFYRYEPWGKITGVLRAGSGEGFSETHKSGSLDFLKDKPAHLEVFQKAMTNLSVTENETLAKNYDFSRFDHVVDVGGGHGTFLRAVMESNPGMHGTLFDLEETLASVILPEDPLSERITLTGGNFFESVPATGDLYTMKNILHNWPVEKVRLILNTLHLAITGSPGAREKRVLVIEHLMSEDADAESIAPWMDMNFFILVGGQERTFHEYRELFFGAGFEITKTLLTKTGRSIIELGITPAA